MYSKLKKGVAGTLAVFMAIGTAPIQTLAYGNESYFVQFMEQGESIKWATETTYRFDFGSFPSHMLNYGGQDQRNGFIVTRNNPISNMSHAIRYIDADASVSHFDFIVGGNTDAQGLRPSGPLGNTFLEPNGAGRSLTSNVPLQGPIRIELDVRSVTNNGNTTVPFNFGERSTVLPVTGHAIQTVVAEFATLDEGLLAIDPWLWGGNTANDPLGRLGLQAIRIYEGEFVAPWIEIPTGFAFDFSSLPYHYGEEDLIPQSVSITNIGVGTTKVAASFASDNFKVVGGNDAVLRENETIAIAIQPVLGLTSGIHHDKLMIATDNANVLSIDVTVVVYDAPSLPENIFYGGTGVSNSKQFPHAEEKLDWEHGFTRVSITNDSHLIAINGHIRDANPSLALPFMQNNVLWVPIETAKISLPETEWNLEGNVLSVTKDNRIFETNVLVANLESQGGSAVFVPLVSIARSLNASNIGWDQQSETLILVTGEDVYQGNVLYNAINNRPENWYGSPNSLTIANNLVMMQRSNGGWPRGIGQTGAAPHQPDIGGMDPVTVQQIALAYEQADSYFGRGITTNETRFLLRMYEATGIQRFKESGLRGLDTILDVQDEQGGWPYMISGGSYHRALSISDNAVGAIMGLLQDIEKGAFVETIGENRSLEVSEAFELGLSFILGSQLRSSGFSDGIERLTGWPFAVYQTGVEDLAGWGNFTRAEAGTPAWQREFEPPSISGRESLYILEFLMSIENPSMEIKEAIHSAVYFFDYVAIEGYRLNHAPETFDSLLGRHLLPDRDASRLWARFIDIETFAPLFYDRVEPAGSPHTGINPTDFGSWHGVPANHISQNATSATNARGGIRRNLYRDASGNLSTDSSGEFDLIASFHNLSHERRVGFNYINTFLSDLEELYEAWLKRNVAASYPEWNPTTIFDTGDRVTFNGRTFEAQWWTRNQEPGASPWGPWMEIFEAVYVGDGEYAANWSATKVYHGEELVIYNGQLFRARWWTRNQSPTTPHGPWELIRTIE